MSILRNGHDTVSDLRVQSYPAHIPLVPEHEATVVMYSDLLFVPGGIYILLESMAAGD